MNRARKRFRQIAWSLVFLGLLFSVGCAQKTIQTSIVAPLDTSKALVQAIATKKGSVIPIVCISVSEQTATIQSVEGTGFFVKPDGTFMTADHVIAGTLAANRQIPCTTTAFYLPQDGVWAADRATFRSDFYIFLRQACRRDSEIDIATCRSLRAAPTAHPITVVEFDGIRPPDGTPIAFVGFPLQYQLPLSAIGSLAGYAAGADDNRGPRELNLDRAAWPGASGSPIFGVDGKVIGLLRLRGINEGSGRSIGVPSRLIQEFLAVTP